MVGMRESFNRNLHMENGGYEVTQEVGNQRAQVSRIATGWETGYLLDKSERRGFNRRTIPEGQKGTVFSYVRTVQGLNRAKGGGNNCLTQPRVPLGGKGKLWGYKKMLDVL